jgi:DNA-binding transcriptional MerR regulator
MVNLRPSDLAREHGLSAQAVRNYERDGCLPPAARTRSGYRVYTEVHAAALRAFLALVRAYGHVTAVEVMHAVHDDDLDGVLMIIDRGHEQLLRDRSTLDSVRAAIARLTESAAPPARTAAPFRVGELARRLRVTPATLRNWEDAGILAPQRDRGNGYRCFDASDVRDAELAHLLRRGGYPLSHIAAVVQQVRAAGGAEALSAALEGWQRRLTRQGLAMLDAASQLSAYLAVRGDGAIGGVSLRCRLSPAVHRAVRRSGPAASVRQQVRRRLGCRGGAVGLLQAVHELDRVHRVPLRADRFERERGQLRADLGRAAHAHAPAEP